MIRTREQKGITLVALIITIIVLLILAVVAIRAVQGDGIIQHAQNARNEYIIGEAKEKEVLRDYLIKLEEEVSETPYIVHNDTIPVGGIYKVAGTETELKSEEGKYVKFPEEVKTGDIYIYGDYEYRYNMYSHGGGRELKTDENQNGWSPRVTENNTSKTSYGSVLTTINGKNITNMYCTFYGCDKMITAPAIPNTVTNLYGAFYGCYKLTNAPKIPNGVTNMGLTFLNCNSLAIGPTIPESVTNMRSTFSGCTSLTTAPTIPDNVTNMYQTFYKCTSLTKAPEIPNGVTNMQSAFSSCTSLTKVTEIPNSVTNMAQTFYGCKELTGTIEINVTEFIGNDKFKEGYEGCFYGTEKEIVLKGTNEDILTNLISTANNGNVGLPKENS